MLNRTDQETEARDAKADPGRKDGSLLSGAVSAAGETLAIDAALDVVIGVATRAARHAAAAVGEILED
ncbi:hypothetical protein [Defluviimonas salinarum]|uniref:Uncharacterized protein n=1 Tax=Defluviimonas salinarum TaxID=2992147 RepID=A0ABT3J9P2_9RHOB|nr:hypothetical protein [Defluviimonas salinarum]MCW3784391.1 hypothetical protein [Defluviimonas salinarum]